MTLNNWESKDLVQQRRTFNTILAFLRRNGRESLAVPWPLKVEYLNEVFTSAIQSIRV